MRIDDLTFPRPGSTTLREILARAVPLLVRQYLELPAPRGDAAPHAQAVARIAALVREDPSALVAIFRRPPVSCLVAQARRSVTTERYAAELLALDLSILIELACLGRVAFELGARRAAGPWPRVLTPTGRLELALDDDVESVTFAPGRVTARAGDRVGSVELADRASWLAPGVRVAPAYAEIVPGIVLALADDNPVARVQLHPERLGNALDLAGHGVEAWADSIRDALLRVERHLPELGPEIRLLVQVLVPVGFDPERHFSCSYPDCIGAIYLSLHPRPMTMTEALVHEHQHQKLHLLERLGPILRNADDERYRSPVRPDPRPLHGVLLAVHALQPIARLHERMLEAGDPLTTSRDFKAHLCELVEAAHEGAETLRRSARPTELGAPLLRELLELDAYFAGRASAAFRA